MMGATIIRGLLGATLAMAAYGPIRAKGIEGTSGGAATDAPRVTLGGNLSLDPCFDCNYYPNPSGLAVLGPNNCTVPGSVEWLAVPFIAATTGVPKRISASIILHNPTGCPANEVTLGIYTDACYPTGVGTLLVSGVATVPSASCNLAVANLRNAPTLIEGTKYWVAATTNAAEAGLDALWYSTNYAQNGYNHGDGWAQYTGKTPGFAVEGSGTLSREVIASHPSFANNLIVDPCTGCIYDPSSGGFSLRGPDNCSSHGSTNWVGVPFFASFSGVPGRISAGISLLSPASCPQNKVTLSIYTDNCGLGPGTVLVSGQGSIPTGSCALTIAKLRNAPALSVGTKYWVVATTTAAQSSLDATWWGSNNSQFAIDLGDGWTQANAITPAFSVE